LRYDFTSTWEIPPLLLLLLRGNFVTYSLSFDFSFSLSPSSDIIKALSGTHHNHLYVYKNGIAFPSFAGAREKGKNVTEHYRCVDNVLLHAYDFALINLIMFYVVPASYQNCRYPLMNA
jgi:hypothetical protein